MPVLCGAWPKTGWQVYAPNYLQAETPIRYGPAGHHPCHRGGPDERFPLPTFALQEDLSGAVSPTSLLSVCGHDEVGLGRSPRVRFAIAGADASAGLSGRASQAWTPSAEGNNLCTYS